jgi:hypothetical protein
LRGELFECGEIGELTYFKPEVHGRHPFLNPLVREATGGDMRVDPFIWKMWIIASQSKGAGLPPMRIPMFLVSGFRTVTRLLHWVVSVGILKGAGGRGRRKPTQSVSPTISNSSGSDRGLACPAPTRLRGFVESIP